MKTEILAGFEKDIRDEVKDSFKTAGTFRRHFRQVLGRKRDEKIKALLFNSNLKENNYEASQIDRIAYARALEDVISLLEN